MRKTFIIAAAAALALGVTGCQKPGGNDILPNGDTKTQLQLALVLPASSGQTRGFAQNSVAGTTDENKVSSVDIYLFKADGSGVDATGGAHTHFGSAQLGTAFTAPGSGGTVWTMNSPIDATAGNNMKIYVGINLPSAMDKLYSSETALLDEAKTIAEMSSSVASTGLSMMSYVAAKTLLAIPVGSDFATEVGKDATFNTVQVDAFRTVAKVVATSNKFATPSAWKVVWDAAPLELTYTPTHWRVMQHATSSKVVPAYNPKDYFPGGSLVSSNTRPNAQGIGISTYAADVDNTTGPEIDIAATTTPTEAQISDYTVVGGFAKYVGENAREGAANALNKNTTYAFIATGMNASHEVVWENGAIAWKAVAGGYGWTADADNATTNKDIYLIKYDNRDYLTSSQANADAIATGIAAANNILIVPDTDADPTTPADNPLTDEVIEMSIDEFMLNFKFNVYKYEQGYVHHMWFINGSTTQSNRYEVLRNEFIHLSVGGMDTSKKDVFPQSWPGVAGAPRKPIDPTSLVNNPFVIDGDDPVDPAKTSMKVNVNIHPWSYKVNTIIIGQ